MPDGHAPRPPDLVVKVAEAKARLSELIKRAEAGEHVVIARGGEPVVSLTVVPRQRAKMGFLRDTMTREQLAVLDAQLDDLEKNGWYTEEELDEFEGGKDLDEVWAPSSSTPTS